MNGVLLIAAGVLLLFVVIAGKTECLVQCWHCLASGPATVPA